MFIVELLTTTGKVCESFATYEEARRRVELFPEQALVGLPLIFQELPDGSQRVVRDDGKPLQWHRLEDDSQDPNDQPLPLSDEPSSLVSEGGWRLLTPARPADDTWDEPLETIDLPFGDESEGRDKEP